MSPKREPTRKNQAELDEIIRRGRAALERAVARREPIRRTLAEVGREIDRLERARAARR